MTEMTPSFSRFRANQTLTGGFLRGALTGRPLTEAAARPLFWEGSFFKEAPYREAFFQSFKKSSTTVKGAASDAKTPYMGKAPETRRHSLRGGPFMEGPLRGRSNEAQGIHMAEMTGSQPDRYLSRGPFRCHTGRALTGRPYATGSLQVKQHPVVWGSGCRV